MSQLPRGIPRGPAIDIEGLCAFESLVTHLFYANRQGEYTQSPVLFELGLDQRYTVLDVKTVRCGKKVYVATQDDGESWVTVSAATIDALRPNIWYRE